MPLSKNAPVLRASPDEQPVAHALVQIIDTESIRPTMAEVKMTHLANLVKHVGGVEICSARKVAGILDTVGVWRHGIKAWTLRSILVKHRDDIARYAGVPTIAEEEAEMARIAQMRENAGIGTESAPGFPPATALSGMNQPESEIECSVCAESGAMKLFHSELQGDYKRESLLRSPKCIGVASLSLADWGQHNPPAPERRCYAMPKKKYRVSCAPVKKRRKARLGGGKKKKGK